MKDTKSNMGKYSLLHYLVSLIEEKVPTLLHWMDEVPELKAGTKGNIPSLLTCGDVTSERLSTVEAEIASLKKGFQQIQDELKETASSDSFKTQMKISFLNQFSPSFL
jgi:septal ring factor EnvC (AmiA/AmiB activator)